MTVTVDCLNCADRIGLGAALWLSVAAPETYNPERMIRPDNVAKSTWPFPFRFTRVHPRDESETVDATVGPLVGRARVFSVQFADGTGGEVIAIGAAQNCLSLFGVIYHGGFAPIVPAEFDALNAATDFEFYQPVPEPLRPPIDLPLGDARKGMMSR